MLSFISAFNSTDAACPWLKQPIPCDFELYTNATDLNESQKLLPNTDITGTSITYMFAATAFMTCALVFSLLADEALLLIGALTKERYAYFRRLVHVIDTLLHSLSDAQIIAGLALLVVALFHSSCISAYHYNVVCYLMSMSLITHIFTFVNVPEFCSKNHLVGLARVIGIIAIFGMTWALFKQRDALVGFPVSANSLAIMPAACFTDNGTITLSSHVSQISGAANANEGTYQYQWIFLPLGTVGIISVLFLIGDSIRTTSDETSGNRMTRWIVWCIRFIITIFLFILAIVATAEHFKLKAGFEITDWYIKTDEDTTSLSQLITLMLSTTSLFAVLRVIFESIDGPRSEKAVGKLFDGIEFVKDNASNAEEGLQLYQVTVNNELK